MESVFLEEISESYFSHALPPSIPPFLSLSHHQPSREDTGGGSHLQEEGPTQELDLLALIFGFQPTEG